jgi:hypothetical protein
MGAQNMTEPTRPLRVLIIDDNADVRSALGRVIDGQVDLTLAGCA